MYKLPIRHLYKVHENEDCLTLLDITRYLHSQGYNIMPDQITERLIPTNTVLPTVTLDDNTILSGLNAIVNYLETTLRINGLILLSKHFVKANPNYRCR